MKSPACHPLTLTRELATFPIANRPLAAHQLAAIDAVPTAEPLSHHPHVWLDQRDLSMLIEGSATTLVSADDTPLAWIGDAPETDSAVPADWSFLIVHPWDFLRANELAMAAPLESRIEGDVHASTVIEGTLQLGSGARVLPGVYIEGRVIIGANCKIGPNCYLRGSTAVGDNCHIGQAVEIKNSILLANTNVGHLSYLGDSILGEKVNFGAGTIVSNLRHDGANHRSLVDGELIDTGRRKFGTIVGDGVHTGIHTSIYPGRKLWPHTSTRPGEIVGRDVIA